MRGEVDARPHVQPDPPFGVVLSRRTSVAAGRLTRTLGVMWNDPLTRDIVIFLGAVGIGLIVAAATTYRARDVRASSVTRMTVGVIRRLPGLRTSADRAGSTRRGQFLTTLFVVFFVVFVLAVVSFDCGHRTGCQ